MSGQLFTRYYLTQGIKSTTRWNSSAANMQAFRDRVHREDETAGLIYLHHQPSRIIGV